MKEKLFSLASKCMHFFHVLGRIENSKRHTDLSPASSYVFARFHRRVSLITTIQTLIDVIGKHSNTFFPILPYFLTTFLFASATAQRYKTIFGLVSFLRLVRVTFSSIEPIDAVPVIHE